MHKQQNRTMIKTFRLLVTAALLAGLALVALGAVGVALVMRARRR